MYINLFLAQCFISLPSENVRKPNLAVFTCSKSIIETLEDKNNMFKVNNKNKPTDWSCYGFVIANFEHISNFSSASISDFEQVNVNWEGFLKFSGVIKMEHWAKMGQ